MLARVRRQNGTAFRERSQASRRNTQGLRQTALDQANGQPKPVQRQ